MPYLTLDYIILGGATLFAITIAFFVGRARMTAIIIATYLGILLLPLFPYLSTLVGASPEAAPAASIQFALLGTFIAIGYLAVGGAMRDSFEEGSYGSAMVALPLGLAFSILVFTIFYHLIPLTPIYRLPPLIDPLFTFENAKFWLLAGPLVLLFLGSRR